MKLYPFKTFLVLIFYLSSSYVSYGQDAKKTLPSQRVKVVKKTKLIEDPSASSAKVLAEIEAADRVSITDCENLGSDSSSFAGFCKAVVISVNPETNKPSALIGFVDKKKLDQNDERFKQWLALKRDSTPRFARELIDINKKNQTAIDDFSKNMLREIVEERKIRSKELNLILEAIKSSGPPKQEGANEKPDLNITTAGFEKLLGQIAIRINSDCKSFGREHASLCKSLRRAQIVSEIFKKKTR